MSISSVLSLSLTELSSALRNKSVSITQVVEQAVAQQSVMADLNALISSAPSSRLQHATQHAQHRQDSGTLLSPLDGVPIVVKDNYCTSWATTTCASKMLRHYTPTYDATLVTRLEAAGAIIIGKSNMDEFGMGSGGTFSTFGPIKNLYRSGKPYALSDPTYRCGALEEGEWVVSGGSSGGSAVAVASGQAYCGLGSDTGGSVRNPASLCGLVGLKPSYGALPRTGLISLVNSMDCPGVLAKTCEDCAMMMAVLLGRDKADSTSQGSSAIPWAREEDEDRFSSADRPGTLQDLVSGLVVGVPSEYHCAGLHPQILQAWTRLADKLHDAGAKVVPVSLPHTPYAPSCYTVLNTCEVASNFTRYTGFQYGLRKSCKHSMEAQYALSRAEGLSQVVKDRVLAGNYFLLADNKENYQQQAMKVRRLVQQDFDCVFNNGVDVLLTPTTLFPATSPSLFSVRNSSELTYLQDLCTSPANLAGLPALSVPVGFTNAAQNSTSSQRYNDGQHYELRDQYRASTEGDGSIYSRSETENGGTSVDDTTVYQENAQCDLSQADVVGAVHGIEGLPLSLQLIGPYGTDRKLLQIGSWVQSTLNVPRTILQDPL